MRKIFILLSLVLAFSMGIKAQTPVRVNCGGPAYTDKAGNVWQADTGFDSGNSYSVSTAISGTSDAPLYQALRYNSKSSLLYTFTVPNGTYNVNLLFAETWNGAFAKGARVFNVKLNGPAVLSNFDVFLKAGADTADTETFPVAVTNGSITIEFDSITQNPIINAIDIEPTGSLLPVVTLNINTGSVAVYDDQTPILPGQITVSQLQAPNTTVTIGDIISDSSGNLTGSITINPNWVDVNGNLTFLFGLPIAPNLIVYSVSVGQFQHSSTGLTINLTLFKQSPLAIKSQLIAVTP